MYQYPVRSEELYHFGVLGMHWGERRYQPYSTVPRGSGKGGKEIGEAAKKTKKSRETNVRMTPSNIEEEQITENKNISKEDRDLMKKVLDNHFSGNRMNVNKVYRKIGEEKEDEWRDKLQKAYDDAEYYTDHWTKVDDTSRKYLKKYNDVHEEFDKLAKDVLKHSDSDDELYHYGVPGMKWGVRHDPEKAYAKGVRKIAQYQDKYDKYTAKAAKLSGKNSKYSAKSNRAGLKSAKLNVKADKLQRTVDKRVSRGKRVDPKLAAKAQNARAKANKYDLKYQKKTTKAMSTATKLDRASKQAQKYAKKGQKTYDAMIKVFGKAPTVSELNNYRSQSKVSNTSNREEFPEGMGMRWGVERKKRN